MKNNQRTCPACGTPNEMQAKSCFVCGGDMSANFFDVLGLPIDASIVDIHKAYRRAASRCHPDKTAHLSPELQNLAENKMRQLNHIWEIFKDNKKRERYIKDLQKSFKPDWQNKYTQTKPKEATEQPDTETQASSSTQARTVTAFRRLLARLVDYLLISLVVFALVRIPAPTIIQWTQLYLPFDQIVVLGVLGLFFIMMTTFLWVWLEALLLAQFETTPGKWLMRLRVLDAKQNTLTSVAALERALTVWSRGMAGGVIIFMPFVWLYWQRVFARGETLPWDEIADSKTVVDQSSIFVYIASAIICVQSAAMIYYYWQDIDLFIPSQPRITTTPSQPGSLEPTATTTAITTTEPAQLEPVEPPAELSELSAPANHTAMLTPTQPELKPELVLPPPLRSDWVRPPAPEIERPKQPLPTPLAQATVSAEDRAACMKRYFDTMHRAIELPMGDYVRMDRKARKELEHCLK